MSETKKIADEYNELLCQAIDTIVAARLSDLKFDRTVVCTITDTSKHQDGIYTVTDGATTFEATADYTSYSNGTKVQVTIPNGDYGAQKQIIGRYNADVNDKPIVHVAPVDQIANLSGNLAEGLEDMTITATSDTISNVISVLTYTAKDVIYNTEIFDTIGVKAKFTTSFTDENKSGVYGLFVTVEADKGIYVFNLSSEKDMFGQVYNFYQVPQNQAYKFESPVGVIKSIKVDLYQDGNFAEGQEPEQKEITISDLEVFIGANMSTVEDNTLKIYTNDSLVYDPTTRSSETDIMGKKVSLIWYDKGPGNKFLPLISDSNVCERAHALPPELLTEKEINEASTEDTTKNYYWIEWYASGANATPTLLKEGNETTCDIPCQPKLLRTEAYAVLWFNKQKYISNSIVFENRTNIDNLVLGKDITIAIENGENAQDAYPIYGEDNLAAPGEANETRTIKLIAKWLFGELSPDYWTGATVEWSIPAQLSMLKGTSKKYGIGFSTQDIEMADWETATQFQYRLNEAYFDTYYNNTITCTVTLPDWKGGYNMTATKTVGFSTQGTSGTDYTIVVKPIQGNQKFGFAADAEEATLKEFTAELYDPQGQLIEGQGITLERYPSEETGNFSYNSSFNVLKASTNVSWAGRSVNLETYYPVIYSKNDSYVAQVPIKIVYDSFGSLVNLKSGFELKLFNISDLNKPLSGVTWSLHYTNISATTDKDELSRMESQIPQLSENTIIAPSMYTGVEGRVWVQAKYNNEIVWTSPLIIQQDKYDSKVLSNWDGGTIVDTANNRILTNAFAAGKMDSKNAFSGVILGEVGKIVDENHYAQTGLYGYNSGAQVYGFKGDGTAFIGKSGTGRIYFDGNSGVIASAGWIENDIIKETGGKGLKIDLTEGSLLSKNFSIDKDGNASFNGDLIAKTLTLTTASTNTINNVISANETVKDIQDNAKQAIDDASNAAGAAATAQGTANEAKGLAEESKSYAETNIGKLDKAVAEYLSGGEVKATTILGSDYVISPYIGGGYLNITGNGSQVIIDPKGLSKNKNIFQVRKNGELVIGLDDKGNASFIGKITANEGHIGKWRILSNGVLGSAGELGGNYYGIALDPRPEILADSETEYRVFAIGHLGYGGETGEDADIKAITETWQNAAFRVTNRGKMIATDAEITGKIKATSLELGTETAKEDMNSIINNNGTVQAALNEAGQAKGAADQANADLLNKLDISNITGDFSWEFTPGNGVVMKKGGISVFEINDERNGLWINGGITANNGTIGSLEIYPANEATQNELGLVAMIEKISPKHYGVAIDARPRVLKQGAGQKVFGIGQFSSTDAAAPWGEDLNFYIRADGYMYCKSGSIGGWSITKDSLTGTDGRDEIKLYSGGHQIGNKTFYLIIWQQGQTPYAGLTIDGWQMISSV